MSPRVPRDTATWFPFGLVAVSLLAFFFIPSLHRHHYLGSTRCGRTRLVRETGPLRTDRAAVLAADAGGGGLPSAPSRNYVLTVVSGDLNQNWTSVFIRSWQRHSPDTKVVVFVDKVAEQRQAVLRDFGAELVPFTLPQGAFVVAHRWAGEGGLRCWPSHDCRHLCVEHYAFPKPSLLPCPPCSCWAYLPQV